MRARFLRTLLILYVLFFLAVSPASAAESEMEMLRKEVRELNQTVHKLTDVVEKQNQRIDELEGKAPRRKKEPEKPQIVQENVESKALEPKMEDVATTQPSAPIEGDTRQIGFWKVPTGRGTAWKLLPDISVIGVFAGAYFTQDPGPSGHDPSRTGFNLQEIEVAFQSVIDPYIRADVFLSFLETGVELEEAYITTLALPKGFQIKAGKYLLAFGRQNPKHLEAWPFVNNNLINRIIFGDEGLNELGIEFSYLFPTPFFLQAQFSFNQGENPGNFDGPQKADFSYQGRLSGSTDITPNTTLLAGASVAFGDNNTGTDNTTGIFGGDLLLKWKPSQYKGLEWQTEYIYRRRGVQNRVESEGGISSYVLANWSKRWGAGGRVEYFGIPSETERIFRLSPMITFRTTEFFRLRLQYDLIRNIGSDTQHAAMLQMIFNMGVHGAHQF